MPRQDDCFIETNVNTTKGLQQREGAHVLAPERTAGFTLVLSGVIIGKFVAPLS